MFDARAAKALKDEDHLTVREAHGLRLQRYGESLAWVYRCRSPVDATLRQVRLGAWPAMSVTAAIVTWDRRRSERVARADPQLNKRREREVQALQAGLGHYTVRKASDEWLKAYRGTVTAKTYGEAEAKLHEFWLAGEGGQGGGGEHVHVQLDGHEKSS